MAGFNVVSEKKLDCNLLVELQANHVMLLAQVKLGHSSCSRWQIF